MASPCLPIRFDAAGWAVGVRRADSPNCDERPEQLAVDVLVVHAISLPPGRYGTDHVERLFTNRLDFDEHPYFADLRELRVSAHFLVRRCGEIIQFVSCDRRAWHAGESHFQGRDKVNDFSIGIELEGCDEDAFEPVQYDALAALIRALRERYPGIAGDRVVGHCDISPGRKTDPGPGFDWQELPPRLA